MQPKRTHLFRCVGASKCLCHPGFTGMNCSKAVLCDKKCIEKGNDGTKSPSLELSAGALKDLSSNTLAATRPQRCLALLATGSPSISAGSGRKPLVLIGLKAFPDQVTCGDAFDFDHSRGHLSCLLHLQFLPRFLCILHLVPGKCSQNSLLSSFYRSEVIFLFLLGVCSTSQ